MRMDLPQLIAQRGDRFERAKRIVEWIQAARGYGWVGLYDVLPTEIAAIAWTVSAAPAFPRFSRSTGLNGAAVAAGTPLVVQDVTQDPRYLTTFGSTRAEAIFPIRCGPADTVLGTLDVASEQVGAFTPVEQAFLANCAIQLAAFWP
jgi:putative methionine-R-sulfoxide reductase with GAF domain